MKNILLTIITLLLLLSCTPHDPAAGKLKSSYSTQRRDTITYAYDTRGRLSGYVTSSGERDSYDYGANTISETNNRRWKAVFFLDAAGHVDSMISLQLDPSDSVDKVSPAQIVVSFGNPILRYYSDNSGIMRHQAISKKFRYDPSGALLSESEYVDGKIWTKTDRTIQDGMLASYSFENSAMDTVTMINPVTLAEQIKIIRYAGEIHTFIYLSGKPNTLSISNWYGTNSKDLIEKEISYNLPKSKDSVITSYSYTFDNKNRVTSYIKSVRSTDPHPYNTDASLTDTCSFTYY